MASRTVILKASGLATHPNELGSVPEGSLKVAENVNVDKDDVMESRRGYRYYGPSFGSGSDRASQLFSYKNRLHRHVNTTISYDNQKLVVSSLTSSGTTATATTASAHGLVTGQLATITGADYAEYNVVDTAITVTGPTTFTYSITNSTVSPATGSIYLETGVFTNYSGTISPPDTGFKIRTIEQNSNLYLTTDAGIKKLEAIGSSILDAGIPKGLDVEAELVAGDSFFEQNNQIAYRVVWGREDANTNLILGAPSQRTVITNRIEDLLITDINNALVEADANAAIKTSDYKQTLIIGNNSTASEILGDDNPKSGLKGFAAKLDEDATITTGLLAHATNPPVALVSGSTYKFEFSTSISNVTANMYLVTTGYTASGNNGVFQITAVGSNYVEVTNAAGAAQAADTGTERAHILLNNNVLNYDTDISKIEWQSGNTIRYTLADGVSLANLDTDSRLLVSGSTNSSNNGLFQITAVGANYVEVTNTSRTSAVDDELGVAEVSSVTTDAAGANTNGKYFLLNSANNENKYYVWFYTGTEIDPAILNRTGIRVGITAGWTANQVATKLAADLDATADFAASAALSVVTITNANPGPSDNINIGTMSGTWAVSTTTAGSDAIGVCHILQNQFSALVGDAEVAADIQGYYDAVIDWLNGIVATGAAFDNASTSSKVNVTFTVPPGITTEYFYQVYRTLQSGDSTVDPGEEYYLVYEDAYTSGTTITILDEATEDFMGAALYTNSSQEGALQTNDQPPFAKDMALYKNSMFYANTRTKHRLYLDLLGVSDLTSGVSTITIGNQTYTFRSSVAEVSRVTPVADVAGSLAGTYFTINSANDVNQYYIWFKVSGSGSDPALVGKTGVQVNLTTNDAATVVNTAIYNKIITLPDFTAVNNTTYVDITNAAKGPATNIAAGTSGFTVAVQTAGYDGEDVATKKIYLSDSASVGTAILETSKSLIKVVNQTSASNVVGYYLSSSDDPPGKMMFEAKTLASTAFAATVGSAGDGDNFNPTLPTSGTSISSDNEVAPNRVYYSKTQQPEAVPLLNYLDIGAKDYGIDRVLALRDTLFIFKADGIYRITGDSVSSLQLTLMDNTTRIKGRETAVTGNNQIFLFTDQGITVVSETGIAAISKMIKNQLDPYYAGNFSNLDSTAFGIFYDTENKYYLWMPELTTDTTATKAFVYSVNTNAWTTYTVAAKCATIADYDNRMYLGSATSNRILQERKALTYRDNADLRIYNSVISVDGTEVTLSSVSDIEIGDVFVQPIYLTTAKFNSLLSKLDQDSGIVDSNYYTTLLVSDISEIPANLSTLGTKLTNDAGTASTYTTSVLTDPRELQAAFNAIITTLNADSGVSSIDYEYCKNQYLREIAIVGVDDANSSITLKSEQSVWNTQCWIEKAIQTRIEWNPAHAGDPSLLKHFSEAQLLFSAYEVHSAIMGFKSDISQHFEDTEFEGEGPASWGHFSYGEKQWGSADNFSRFRTFIPRNKQKCSFIQARVRHVNAYERFAIVGLALQFRALSFKPNR